MALGMPSLFGDIEQPDIGERVKKTPRLADQYCVQINNDSNPIEDQSAQNNDQFDYEGANNNDFPMEEDSDDDDDDNQQQPKLDPPSEKACTINRDAFRKFTANARQHFGSLTAEEKEQIKLMDILHKNKAPLGAYDSLLEWHLRGKGLLQEGQPLGACPQFTGREALIKKLAKRYHMEDVEPQMKQLVLPSSKAKVNIVTHDFASQLVQVLTDPCLKPDDFLFFDDDPFAPPPNRIEMLGDINTGDAYIKTYKKLITKPGRQLLVPIMFYIDGAVTGQYDKGKVEALQGCLGLLNAEAREKFWTWFPLGLIQNFMKEDSQGKKMLRDSGHLAGTQLDLDEEMGEGDANAAKLVNENQDWHAMLDTMLQSYRRVEQDGMLFDFEYRGKLYPDTELVFFTLFMKADTEEADRLCGSYLNRTKANQLCRYCLCPTDDSDNPLADHGPKSEPMIKRLVARKDVAKLKEIFQHPIQNAFHGLRMGLHNRLGIHGACPLEMLHALLLGIFVYVRNCFFFQMGESSETANAINALSKLFGRFYQRQSDRDMPRTNFTRGIQKGKLMAKEYSGVLLLIATILRSDKGRSILSACRKKNFNDDWLIADWSLLVETLLQWEAFLKQPELPKNLVKRFLDKKHRFIMYLIKKVTRRNQGMGLKILKFHAIVHMAGDILNFGVPMNFDTGVNESHHKGTKVAAKMTKKDLANFEKSTANRIWEFNILRRALEELDGRPLWDYIDGFHVFDVENDDLPEANTQDGDNDGQEVEIGVDFSGQNDPSTGGTLVDLGGQYDTSAGQPSDIGDDVGVTQEEKEAEVSTGGTLIKVSINPQTGLSRFEFPGSRMDKGQHVAWEGSILHFLLKVQEAVGDQLDDAFMPIRTEHRRHGVIFRGHPGYRLKGAWQDWVKIDWGDEQELPGQIWCFIDLRLLKGNAQFGEYLLEPGVYAVVESTTYDDMDDEYYGSSFFKPIRKDVGRMINGKTTKRQFYLADTDAFLEPLVVVPNVGCHPDNQYFEVKPRHKWAEEFEEWLPVDDEEEITND